MIPPLRAAALAKRLRTHARAARQAGDYDRAKHLSLMALAAQDHAITADFTNGRAA